MNQQKNTPVQDMNFESALTELESIIAKLEKADIPLDEGISLYERALLLQNHCSQKLRDAQIRIDELSRQKNSDGSEQIVSKPDISL